MGEQCPDYLDSRGRQQCAKTMQVFCMLPLISMYGVFEIDTKSNHSIASFHNMVRFVQGMNGGIVKGIPFRISRVETVTNFTDPRSGEKRSGTQYIMELHPNEEFQVKYGEDVCKKLQNTFANSNILLPPPEELLQRPSGDAFALEEGKEDDDVDSVDAQKVAIATAETVAADPEVNEAFDRLEQALKKGFSPKARLIAIRKKEGEPDIKAAVLAEVNAKVMLAGLPAVPQGEYHNCGTDSATNTTTVVPEMSATADAVQEATHTAGAVHDAGEVM
jgi:uncharacterized Zn-binding protein involved in type VI secretion